MLDNMPLCSAYIIHTRPFRENSIIVECFTRDHGRVSLIARSSKSKKRSQSALFQPFTPVLISWKGKSELKKLLSIEADGRAFQLGNKYLYSALYLNELLYRLLMKHDSYPHVYIIYERTLHYLQEFKGVENGLRLFEHTLLEELGYAMDLNVDFETLRNINEESEYLLLLDKGVLELDSVVNDKNKPFIFSGRSLIAIANKKYQESDEARRDAKRFMRLVLAPHLGYKPLNTRALFQAT